MPASTGSLWTDTAPDDGPFARSLQLLRRQNQAWFGCEMRCRSLCSFLCPSAALGIVCTNAGIGNIGYAGSFFSVAALIICFFFLSASVPDENAEHWTKWWKIIHKSVGLAPALLWLIISTRFNCNAWFSTRIGGPQRRFFHQFWRSSHLFSKITLPLKFRALKSSWAIFSWFPAFHVRMKLNRQESEGNDL